MTTSSTHADDTAAAATASQNEERHNFQAEVSRLLDIVTRSLYSQKEVFLRELISNASDACDKLRYASLTEPGLIADDPDFRIRLSFDTETRRLTVADNGIGMSRDELVDSLGTIARSGTLSFVDQLTGDAKKDMSLIGQFGVGFYSAFMVSDTVEVITRKAGTEQGYRWVSDGKGAFSVAPVEGPVPRGTQVILNLSEGEEEFCDETRLGHIVRTYSDHIALPIVLEGTDEGEKQLNTASALWTRPKSEISEDDYKEFYHHAGHAFDDPWLTVHWRAEGMIEYTALLFLPSTPPMDLYHPERHHHVKLYVRRVFVSEQADGLIAPYLRFLKGVVDSEDLPLNVSREMLQNNPTVARIRKGVTKKILSELQRKANDDPEGYATFWSSFGAVLKEGLYDDTENRDALLSIARFRSSASDGLVTLDDYVGRMKEGQESIFYATGTDAEALKRSPHLEGFHAKGVEVLLLTDPVDEFWVPALGAYQEKTFKSVTRGGADLEKIASGKDDEDADKSSDDADENKNGEIGTVIAAFKLALKDEVKDVRVSHRLTESPVCLVADDSDMDIQLERLLKQHGQLDSVSKRILEINPKHPLITALARNAGPDGDADTMDDMAYLLLDQARIVEGDDPSDPAAFARRLSAALARGLPTN
ncbi:molecular chaperone HtpG [Fodinicurvata sp. EGI_FJ10296]|uniref:molecular chaperone HtpG n=1 Tax=Fodinicurvata sp. EGI_FJ10296 TaxID=3231908 RepID=UPI003452F7CA